MRTISMGQGKGEAGALPDLLVRHLPFRILDALGGVRGRIEEIRLCRGRQMTVTVDGRTRFLPVVVGREEMESVLAQLASGSLYAHEGTLKEGFLMLPGGIRVGVAGHAATKDGRITGISEVTSLCIRIPGHFPVSGQFVRGLLERDGWSSGVLIWSPPGEGKTTLLRAVALACSGETQEHPAKRVAFCDTREETDFPEDGGAYSLDVLRGYPKADGIAIACRTLHAEVILCDEIGAEETQAVLAAANCGVPLVATAHAASAEGLLRRPGFAELHRAKVFGTYVGIRKNGIGGFRYETCTWEAANAFEADRRDPVDRGGNPADGAMRTQ